MKQRLLHCVSEATIMYLEEEHLSLSHLWILERIMCGDLISEEVKKSSPYLTLERKGYILGNELTKEGDNFIHNIWDSYSAGIQSNLLFDPTTTLDPRLIEKEKCFEEWWTAYPPTDRILNVKGGVFRPGTRTLRLGKVYCRDKYFKILDEYRHEDLMASLHYEIETRIKQSFDKGENILSFMQNSKTYLLNKSFEGFMVLVKEDNEKRESNPNTFHI